MFKIPLGVHDLPKEIIYYTVFAGSRSGPVFSVWVGTGYCEVLCSPLSFFALSLWELCESTGTPGCSHCHSQGMLPLPGKSCQSLLFVTAELTISLLPSDEQGLWWHSGIAEPSFANNCKFTFWINTVWINTFHHFDSDDSCSSTSHHNQLAEVRVAVCSNYII